MAGWAGRVGNILRSICIKFPSGLGVPHSEGFIGEGRGNVREILFRTGAICASVLVNLRVDSSRFRDVKPHLQHRFAMSCQISVQKGGRYERWEFEEGAKRRSQAPFGRRPLLKSKAFLQCRIGRLIALHKVCRIEKKDQNVVANVLRLAVS